METLDVLVNETKVIDAAVLPKCKENTLRINFLNDEKNVYPVYESKQPNFPFARSEVFFASIQCWRRLTPESSDCKNVYEVQFDVTNSNFEFKAGDTIGITPCNHESEINIILDHLDLQTKADNTYTLTTTGSTKIPAHVPVKSTLRYVLKHCIDLRSIVKKLFLLDLYKYTYNETEKNVLAYLSSKEGSICYNKYVLNQKLCILDLFKIFKSCKPPIEILLNHLGRLLPRPYSIVNSGMKSSDHIKICFSLMDIGHNRKGLVTSWLEDKLLKDVSLSERMNRLQIKDCNDEKVPIYLRSNIAAFSLPQSIDKPLILIGPGTGVAPFIAFLEEIEITSSKSDKKGDVWLFCGCRDPELDYIYKNELEDFKNRGVLTELSIAFSRVEGYKNKYVQDSILTNGQAVVNLIHNGAFVYVCGDVKTMAAQVREVFIQCVSKYKETCVEAAETYIKDMENQKRFIIDIWS